MSNTGALKLLREMVEADIRRDGETSSTMVRAGLLRDILDEVLAQRIEAGTDETLQAAQPVGREPDGEADAPK